MLRTLISDIENLAKTNENIEFYDLNVIDAELVSRLHRANDYPGADSAEAALLKRQYLGAFVENNLVGFISYDVDTKPGLICNLLVDKNYRRKGLGSMLIKEAEKKLQEKGITEPYLHVRTTNTATKDLYEKLGYKITSTLEGYYKNNPGDAYEMRKS